MYVTNILLSKKKLFLFVLTFIISIFTAFRIFGFDRDYLNYQKFFQKSAIDDYNSRFEPGFELFTNNFILLFGNNSFVTFLFVVAFISLYLKLSILQNLKNFFLLTLIYIMLILPLYEMMQIRIALASSVMYYALYKSTHSGMRLLNRIILVIVGVSFHYSAIFLAPFIIFERIFKKNLRVINIFLVSFLFIIFINIGIEIAANYLNIVKYYVLNHTYMPTNLFSSRNIIFTLINIIGLINIKNIPKEKLPWFYVSFLGLSVWYGLFWLPVAAHRFFEITIFAYLIWIPSLPKNYKNISLSLLFLFSVYFLIRALFISPFFR